MKNSAKLILTTLPTNFDGPSHGPRSQNPPILTVGAVLNGVATMRTRMGSPR